MPDLPPSQGLGNEAAQQLLKPRNNWGFMEICCRELTLTLTLPSGHGERYGRLLTFIIKGYFLLIAMGESYSDNKTESLKMNVANPVNF